MRSIKSRLVGPDVLKIVATVYVIFIHHKVQSGARFALQHTIMLVLWGVLALSVSVFFHFYSREKGWSREKYMRFLWTPILVFLSLLLLRKYAVTVFFVVSGYMLTGSLERSENPLKSWYRRENLVPRILRFYLTLLPIFAAGIFIQVCFKGYSLQIWSLPQQFMLGGFTPGSYYVFAMAQFMLVFPILYCAVKRFGGKAVLVIIFLTLCWDIWATLLSGYSATWYKYWILRLLPHMTLGIYAKTKSLKTDWFVNYCMLLLGIVYLVLFCLNDRVQTELFYQWKSASVMIAIFMYPIIVFVLRKLENVQYSETKLSYALVNFSNATYHIFLFQMLYYRMIGYEFNYAVDNIILTMPVNMVVCLTGGILFYKWFSPLETKLIAYIKQRITPKKRKNENITASQ